MPASRPDFNIDLPAPRPPYNETNPGKRSPGAGAGSNLPSPRSGDVPPALSPLDALAYQGRLLAARFEESDGRRISRLPPLTVASEFAKPRLGYFNALASAPLQSSTTRPSGAEPPGTSPEVARQELRHRSYYPSIFDNATLENAPSLSRVPSNPSAALETLSEERSGSSTNVTNRTPRWPPPRSPRPIPDANASQRQPQEFRRAPPPQRNEWGHPRNQRTNDYTNSEFGPPRKQRTNESLQSNASSSLAPPSQFSRSPRPQDSSIRSVPQESGDESDAMSFHSESYTSRSRYDRTGSAAGMGPRPLSPYSPLPSGRRSPSISSVHSAGESTQPRRSTNFSRPMSPSIRQGGRTSLDERPSFESSTRMLTVESPQLRPSIDVLSIDESMDSPNLRPLPYGDESVPTITDDEPTILSENGAPSYIYAKYSLPRGRMVSRSSIRAQDWLAHKFEWETPAPESNLTRVEDEPEPKASLQMAERDITPHQGRNYEQSAKPDSDEQVTKQQENERQEQPKLFRPSRFAEQIDDDSEYPIAETPPRSSAGQRKPSHSRPRSRSFDQMLSASTTPKLRTSNPHLRKPSDLANYDIPRLSLDKRARPRNKSVAKPNERETFPEISTPAPDQQTPEAHLAKGIACHENGALQKSTYHLRIAARAGLPTAMLLYALACRHGWGMRPDQAEGVNWLKKAVDSAKLNVDNDDLYTADEGARNAKPSLDGDENVQPTGNKQEIANDVLARRRHRAQLALSIYELGVSYMNGWGIHQDKALAVRCFEIAGRWGDGDALAEAGFCYAKGVGCKKDLNKAAGLYRKAEEKGIGMAGNSW